MADLTYKQLQHAVNALGKDVARACDAIRTRAHKIEEEAKDTARVAEMIAGMGVDTATTGETTQLANTMTGVSTAAIAYASAADTTARTARAAHDQAHASHNGIQEAVTRAPVDVSGLKREWLTQE